MPDTATLRHAALLRLLPDTARHEVHGANGKIIGNTPDEIAIARTWAAHGTQTHQCGRCTLVKNGPHAGERLGFVFHKDEWSHGLCKGCAVQMVADRLQHHNPGLGRADAEAMARERPGIKALPDDPTPTDRLRLADATREGWNKKTQPRRIDGKFAPGDGSMKSLAREAEQASKSLAAHGAKHAQAVYADARLKALLDKHQAALDKLVKERQAAAAQLAAKPAKAPTHAETIERDLRAGKIVHVNRGQHTYKLSLLPADMARPGQVGISVQRTSGKQDDFGQLYDVPDADLRKHLKAKGYTHSKSVTPRIPKPKTSKEPRMHAADIARFEARFQALQAATDALRYTGQTIVRDSRGRIIDNVSNGLALGKTEHIVTKTGEHQLLRATKDGGEKYRVETHTVASLSRDKGMAPEPAHVKTMTEDALKAHLDAHLKEHVTSQKDFDIARGVLAYHTTHEADRPIDPRDRTEEGRSKAVGEAYHASTHGPAEKLGTAIKPARLSAQAMHDWVQTHDALARPDGKTWDAAKVWQYAKGDPAKVHALLATEPTDLVAHMLIDDPVIGGKIPANAKGVRLAQLVAERLDAHYNGDKAAYGRNIPSLTPQGQAEAAKTDPAAIAHMALDELVKLAHEMGIHDVSVLHDAERLRSRITSILSQRPTTAKPASKGRSIKAAAEPHPDAAPARKKAEAIAKQYDDLHSKPAVAKAHAAYVKALQAEEEGKPAKAAAAKTKPSASDMIAKDTLVPIRSGRIQNFDAGAAPDPQRLKSQYGDDQLRQALDRSPLSLLKESYRTYISDKIPPKTSRDDILDALTEYGRNQPVLEGWHDIQRAMTPMERRLAAIRKLTA